MNPFENGSAIVGVQFDEHLDEFISSVADYAKAFQAKVTLLHVWEPKLHHAPISTIPDLGFREALFDIDKEALEKRLTDLAKRFPEGHVATKVGIGSPSEVLKAEAISSGSDMIVIGAHHKRYHLMPKMISTALSLATGSATPILVIPPKSTFKAKGNAYRILVADDLEEHSTPALTLGRQLYEKSGPAELHHFYAQKMTRSMIKEAADKILQAMNTGTIPLDKDFDADD